MTMAGRQAHIESLARRELAKGQRPTALADWVGAAYVAGRSDEHRKNYGLYLTPPAVADLMAGMIEPKAESVRLLDPDAGAGVLLCAAVEHLVAHPYRPRAIELTACEIDADLCALLRLVLNRAITWAAEQGVAVTAEIRQQDFILANAPALDGNSPERFDVVIANPPYFKIGKGDPRAVAARSVVHGQPNIYGLFMAVGAALLHPGGDFVFITPRSFASGPYFKLFRECFFDLVRPVRTHIFGSRREAFSRDDVLQENVILHAVRDDRWMTRPGRRSFTISSSAGVADLDRRLEWSADIADILDIDEPGSVFRLPSSPEDGTVLRLVDGWAGSLHAYGLEISTGPVVPFRATEWLAERRNGSTVPLIWMNHVRAMELHWPNGTRKPQHIVSAHGSRRLLLPNLNYVVLRRSSAKEERRRLTAAPLLSETTTAPLIGLENHLNYIHRPGGTLSKDEAWGLAALYNSALFDAYFRCINGNTQVGATELRAMPLPPIERIVALGRRVQGACDPLATIDELVMDMTTDDRGDIVAHKDEAVA
ncbi:MAG: adenine-specific DNA-methyltransferase [Thermomicrobiales bacterium]|jgi:adenine-specific DNA-methyltransferase|nr:adenine-specific DNA-methyltransferase [Thermomicrobiales bacterium]